MLASYPRKMHMHFLESWENKGSKKHVPVVCWSAIRVGFIRWHVNFVR
jgi:hypothetical protein